MSRLSSNVASLLSEEAFLGPARVVEVKGDAIDVELEPGLLVRAELALAFPYAPLAGDVLLVIGRTSAYYVIGVLHGRGKTALTFSGDVDLHAEGGALNLTGDKGVHIRGPEIAMEAGVLRTFAERAVEKFTSLHQRVREALNLHVGQANTIVDGSSMTTAKSASILTEETMSINGKEIHLG